MHVKRMETYRNVDNNVNRFGLNYDVLDRDVQKYRDLPQGQASFDYDYILLSFTSNYVGVNSRVMSHRIFRFLNCPDGRSWFRRHTSERNYAVTFVQRDITGDGRQNEIIAGVAATYALMVHTAAVGQIP